MESLFSEMNEDLQALPHRLPASDSLALGMVSSELFESVGNLGPMVQRYSEQGRSFVPCHVSKSQGEMALALALINSTGASRTGGRTRLRLAYGGESEHGGVPPARTAFCWIFHLAPAGIPAPPPQPTRLLLLFL